MKQSIPNDFEQMDFEDFHDAMATINQSYGITVSSASYSDKDIVFGQLIEQLTEHMNFPEKQDCTSQQAFYKFRKALSEQTGIPITVISPASVLKEILPIKNRRRKVAEMERIMGVKMNLLRPPYWLTTILLSLLLAGIIVLCFSAPYGACMLLAVCGAFKVAFKYGIFFDSDLTVGRQIRLMVPYNYQQLRRQTGTVNKREVAPILSKFFEEAMGLKSGTINPNTILRVVHHRVLP